MHSHTEGCNSVTLAIWTAHSANTTNRAVFHVKPPHEKQFSKEDSAQTAKDWYNLNKDWRNTVGHQNCIYRNSDLRMQTEALL